MYSFNIVIYTLVLGPKIYATTDMLYGTKCYR
jgi:hypothetical protein